MSNLRTEHKFILQDDGKIYLQDGDSAVEVSNQEEVLKALEIGNPALSSRNYYSLLCSVEKIELPLHPLEKARESAANTTYVPKSLRTIAPNELAKPKRKFLALVTFPESGEKKECPKCRTLTPENCHSMYCPMRDESGEKQSQEETQEQFWQEVDEIYQAFSAHEFEWQRRFTITRK
jgi:hypothetical protein